MTLEHITHQLTCGECQASLRRAPAAVPAIGQCSLDLDEGRHWCPHPQAEDSDWCRIHRAAILAARAAMDAEADPDTPAALAEAIEQADRQLGSLTGALREIDEGLGQLRALGRTETEMFAFRVERDRIAGELGRLQATKRQAEARLAAIGRPGTPDGS